MQIFDTEITFEIEWVDLQKCQIGIIVNAKRGSCGKTARVILGVSPVVTRQINDQIKLMSHLTAAKPTRFHQWLIEIAQDGDWEYSNGDPMSDDAQQFLDVTYPPLSSTQGQSEA